MINPPVLTVDDHQTDMYAESWPLGFIRIGTWLKQQGHRVSLLDMMGYPDKYPEGACTPERLWGYKRAGDNTVKTLDLPVYLYGMSPETMRNRLAALDPPDEIHITACISYNYEVVFCIIGTCRDMFPKAVIRMGGFYPTYFPDHARESGAHDIHQGPFEPAETVPPDFSLLAAPPPVWIFKLSDGCRFRCSYCANGAIGKPRTYSPRAAADDIERMHKKHGLRYFSNWDPNIMLHPDLLDRFLDELIQRALPVRIKFEMGVQPDRLTETVAEKMYRAGCRAMTIPFESAEPDMLKRFGKPYRVEDSLRAMAVCRKIGFDTRRFHCTFVVGIRDEGFRHLFRTYFAIVRSGGRPTPFPLTVTPGTREWDLHEPFLRGKGLDELNGHLWPCLGSRQDVAVYRRILAIISRPPLRQTRQQADALPPEARQAFFRYAGETHWLKEFENA